MSETLRSRLPEQALDLLDCQDGRVSEWATAIAIGLYCLNVDLTESEFVELVSASDFAYQFASENGRDRSNRLESRLRKVWSRCEDLWEPPLGSKADVRKRLAGVAALVESYPWKGRAGITDRAVASALLARGHENGAWTLDMSVRLLAELSGTNKDTVSRSLKRLVKLGLVKRQEVETNDRTAAACWGIVLDWNPEGTSGRDTTHTHKPSPPSVSYVYRVCPFNHPVFLTAALGQTAGRIWNELPDSGSVKAADIASSLRLTLKTARRNLDLLVSVGLATKSEGRPARYSLAPVSTEYLNELAESYGTLDWSERKARLHKEHREGYEQALILKEIRKTTTEADAMRHYHETGEMQ